MNIQFSDHLLQMDICPTSYMCMLNCFCIFHEWDIVVIILFVFMHFSKSIVDYFMKNRADSLHPPLQRSWRGYTGFTLFVRLFVRLTVYG